MFSEKNSVFFVRISKFFYFLKYVINFNTRKLKRSPGGDIVDSNDTWILGCLLYLKIAFNIRWDIFSAKVLTFSNSSIFKILTGLEKKVFEISAFSASRVKLYIIYRRNVF